MKPVAASLPAAAATRLAPAARTVLPQRTEAVLSTPRRLPFQVLQSGREPAQLSLFQRPAFGAR